MPMPNTSKHTGKQASAAPLTTVIMAMIHINSRDSFGYLGGGGRKSIGGDGEEQYLWVYLCRVE
eukprot:scaffold4079_cov44-Cyclotella_meneghiniana.AAC.4